jgi:hypothetical protein
LFLAIFLDTCVHTTVGSNLEIQLNRSVVRWCLNFLDGLLMFLFLNKGERREMQIYKYNLKGIFCICLQRRHDRAGQHTVDEDGRVTLSEGRAVASRCSGCIRWCTNLKIIVHFAVHKNLVIFMSILRRKNRLHIYVWAH